MPEKAAKADIDLSSDSKPAGLDVVTEHGRDPADGRERLSTELARDRLTRSGRNTLEAAARLALEAGRPPVDTRSLLGAIAASDQSLFAGAWLRDQLGSSNPDLLPALEESFRANREIDREDLGDADLTADLVQIIESASRIAGQVSPAERPRVATRHLLAALLLHEPPDGPTGAVGFLVRFGVTRSQLLDALGRAVEGWDFERLSIDESIREWKRALGQGPPASRTAFRTNATDQEICLDAGAYAHAIAEFIRGAEDELCFGLFGHWGRGKTFLMKLVGRRLRAHRYETVPFSAWKYPSTPELWVHLYETLRTAAVTSTHWLPVAFRVGLIKHGPWSLVCSLVLIGLALLPLGVKLELASVVLDVLGVAGAALLLRFAISLMGRGATLRQRFLAIARHDARLGLQAVIGDDLTALVRGWMPRDRQGELDPVLARVFGTGPTLGYCVACAMVAAGLSPWVTARAATGAVEWQTPWPFISLGLSVSFLAGAIGLWFWARAARGGPAHVLLVVDDLDRCAPGALLEVAESLKLYLEEEPVKQRVDVAMLVDEAALSHAILRKYRGLRGGELGDDVVHRPNAHQIVHENIEKIFVAFLRLDPLGEVELEQIAEAVTSRHRREEEAAASDRARRERAVELRAQLAAPRAVSATTERTDLENELRDLERAGPSPPAEHDVTASAPKIVLDSAASEAITEAVRRLPALERVGRVGPRSVRCFVARYLLARQLLAALKEDREPHEIAAAVLGPGDTETAQHVDLAGDEVLISVARQVGALPNDAA